MYFFFDILQYIMARWKQYKTSICIIIVNLIFGICICNFFINFSMNADAYLNRHFFSNSKIRQITIHNNGQPMVKNEEFMNDVLVIDDRKVVDVEVPVTKIETEPLPAKADRFSCELFIVGIKGYLIAFFLIAVLCKIANVICMDIYLNIVDISPNLFSIPLEIFCFMFIVLVLLTLLMGKVAGTAVKKIDAIDILKRVL